MDYHKALDRLRKLPHHELQGVADRSGVSYNTIRGIYYGKTQWPMAWVIERLAKGLPRWRTAARAPALEPRSTRQPARQAA